MLIQEWNPAIRTLLVRLEHGQVSCWLCVVETIILFKQTILAAAKLALIIRPISVKECLVVVLARQLAYKSEHEVNVYEVLHERIECLQIEEYFLSAAAPSFIQFFRLLLPSLFHFLQLIEDEAECRKLIVVIEFFEGFCLLLVIDGKGRLSILHQVVKVKCPWHQILYFSA